MDALVIISAGDLNQNKNNRSVIEAMHQLPNSVHYVICGEGPEEHQLRKDSAAISNRVHFLGYRLDIKELLNASDAFVLSSFREGLSRSLMEAMASGLLCVASDIRGNRDLIQNGDTGLLFQACDITHLKSIIESLYADIESRFSITKRCVANVEMYSVKNVIEKTKEMYKNVILTDNEKLGE